MHNKRLRLMSLACLLILAICGSAWSDQKLSLATDQNQFPATVVINADDQSISRQTFQSTLLGAIDEAGVDLGENDILSLPETTALLPGGQYEINITRMNRVTLMWNGYSIGTSGEFVSVDDLLSRSGYADLDLSDGSRFESDSLSSDASGNIFLNFVDVDKRIVQQYEPIPHSSVTIDDSSLYVGQTAVKTKGVDGQRALIFEETYENGIFIKSEQVGTEIVKQPVQEVIRKGTKVRFVFSAVNRKTLTRTVLNSLAEISGTLIDNGNKSYQSFSDNGNGTITVDGQTYDYTSVKKRTITMYDGLQVCINNGCHTPAINHNSFSGVPAQRGIVAVACKTVDGKVTGTALPMGTIIFVEGYGLGVVGDINGAKTNLDLIDVGYNAGDISAGVATFGKMNSRVYILKTP
jgi:uncharacterized protein YabE (DUF348 family)/3D (Asp-Asp-Asp) domain-containing protein